MFKSEAAEFVYVRTYSRWIEELQRRENWPETVQRYVDFLQSELGDKIPKKVIRKIKEKVLNFEVMPSMRFLWAAGGPAKSDHTTIYNCSYAAVDTVDAFAEALYILMCGTGYGFSVEEKNISQLPVVPNFIAPSGQVHIVEDSKAGWADSLKLLINSLYSGQDIVMDYNKIRPAGARLKTMGGRASGPGPLAQLHSFVKETFNGAKGRKLTSLECHDIMNEIATIVVVGGVRRSSQISLSDLNDLSMREAKMGKNFPVRRYMSNNSAIYYSKPDPVTFLTEWTALIASESGERGIFNLGSAKIMAPERRDSNQIAGTNPCGEIQLRSNEFCNLSEVIARAEDDIDTMLDKVETAVWAGVLQASFTNFPYLNKKWAENCNEERLLGVSITGQMDAPHLFSAEALKSYKAKAIRVAKKASAVMGIPMPSATTCVKPSGTVSQLVDAASGLHPRFSKFYIRRYRISGSDPLFKLVRDQGLPISPENAQRKQDYVKALRIFDSIDNKSEAMIKAKSVCPIFDNQGWTPDKVNTWVVSFPVKSPDNAITVENVSALDQLEWYKKIQTNWCEHNASTTVYIEPDEWLSVGDWVYKNWNIVNGISFMPRLDHVYEQAPNEAITEEQYEKLVENFPKIDYTKLSAYEQEDNTEGAKSLACMSGSCEI